MNAETIHTELRAEECTVELDGDETVFIGVYGYKATDYTLMATVIGGAEEVKNTRVCTQEAIVKNKPCTVSTFHNISVYLSVDNGSIDNNVTVSYKLENENSWNTAQELVYRPLHYMGSKDYNKTDNEDPERGLLFIVKKGQLVSKADYRGSIVNLLPNKTYDIKLEHNGNVQTLKATTWSKNFPTTPIAENKLPQSSNAQYNIEEVHGTAENYILIDGEALEGAGNKYNINGATKFNIFIKNSSYIVLRNFKLENATQDAIRIIGENSHHIVIEKCDISKWGSQNAVDQYDNGDRAYAKDEEAGIHSNSALYGSVFQYNIIYNPNYNSNTWGQFNKDGSDPDYYHPKGAQAITLKYCKGGNNVIRYNEFYSTNGNYFNDVMGGGKNTGAYGFPGADSDIYGNYVANGHDDGIEVEGGDQNVRVWNNYIEKTYNAIANAAVTIGPLYVWRNISGEAERLTKDSCDTGYPIHEEKHNPNRGQYYQKDDGVKKFNDKESKIYGSFLKMGYSSNVKYMQGDMYIFNNTILNDNGTVHISGYGGLGTAPKFDYFEEDGTPVLRSLKKSKNRTMRYIMSRNNILHVPEGMNSISTNNKYSTMPETEDYGYDMVMPDKIINGNPVSLVPDFYTNNKIEATPIYEGQAKLHSTRRGNFRLEENTIGVGEGRCIDNIIPLNNPDVGAQDSNISHMYFGINYQFIVPNIEECDN